MSPSLRFSPFALVFLSDASRRFFFEQLFKTVEMRSVLVARGVLDHLADGLLVPLSRTKTANPCLSRAGIGIGSLWFIEGNELDGDFAVTQSSSQELLDVARQPLLHPVSGKLILEHNRGFSILDR